MKNEIQINLHRNGKDKGNPPQQDVEVAKIPLGEKTPRQHTKIHNTIMGHTMIKDTAHKRNTQL